MTARLHVVTTTDLDLKEVDRRDPRFGRAWDAIDKVLPPRAAQDSDRHRNPHFAVTAELRALISWHAHQEEHGGFEKSCAAVLAGPPGTAKTSGVAWYARHRCIDDVSRGTLFRWYTAAELARSKRLGPERDELIRSASQSDTIVIDDLGAEHVSGSRADDWRADFDELIDAVYRSNCGVALITTNLDAKAFRKRYGRRVVDRLREFGTWIPVEGASMRGKVAP